MKSRSGVSAVVLAAGMSTRMGRLKQLLPFQGRPLLQIVLDTLSGANVDDIVLVLGFAADEIRGQIRLGTVRVVINEAFRDGMGKSLSAGISNLDAETQAALVVLADQPFLRSRTIDQMIAKYLEHKPKIAVPTHKGFRGNPVLVDRSLFPELKALAGDVGCRATFRNHPRDILKIPVNDAGILLDLDNTADLERTGKIDLASTPEDELLAYADLEGRELLESEEGVVLERHLVIVGGHSVAKALAKFGALLKFNVTVVDLLASPADFAGADRVLHCLDFSLLPQAAETYVVAASQGRFDEDAVEQALLMDAKYVALVSNRKKAHDVMQSLALKGIPEGRLLSVKVPAGLDIGAETPEEIALSIMAQIVFERKARGTGNSA